MSRKPSEPQRRIGRPPAGAREGERVKDYPQLSIRLPSEAKAKLQALSLMSGRPQWRLISEAIDCYMRDRSRAEQLLVEQLLRNGDGHAKKPRRREGS
jgi:predicted DNA-binding protein